MYKKIFFVDPCRKLKYHQEEYRCLTIFDKQALTVLGQVQNTFKRLYFALNF